MCNLYVPFAVGVEIVVALPLALVVDKSSPNDVTPEGANHTVFVESPVLLILIAVFAVTAQLAGNT